MFDQELIILTGKTLFIAESTRYEENSSKVIGKWNVEG